MQINYAIMAKMIEEVCTVASSACFDLKDQTIEDVMIENKLEKNAEPRFFSFDELRTYPPGSLFFHPSLGKGEIHTKKGIKGNLMKFESGKTFKISNDSFPWNSQMVYLGNSDAER